MWLHPGNHIVKHRVCHLCHAFSPFMKLIQRIKQFVRCLIQSENCYVKYYLHSFDRCGWAVVRLWNQYKLRVVENAGAQRMQCRRVSVISWVGLTWSVRTNCVPLFPSASCLHLIGYFGVPVTFVEKRNVCSKLGPDCVLSLTNSIACNMLIVSRESGNLTHISHFFVSHSALRTDNSDHFISGLTPMLNLASLLTHNFCRNGSSLLSAKYLPVQSCEM